MDSQAAQVTAWRGPQGWLDSLRATLTSITGQELLHATSIQAATVLDVATVEAGTADSATGRNVRTSHATLAAAVGCSVSTARRARAVIEQLGYATTISVGRYLTAAERQAATAHHGGHQRRVASTRALTIPRGLYAAHAARVTALRINRETEHRTTRNEHLHPKGVSCDLLSPFRVVTKRAAARRRAAERPTRRTNQTWPEPDLAVKRQAAALARHLAWLDPVDTSRPGGHRHLGHLWQALAVLGIDGIEWTWRDLLRAIDDRNAATGKFMPNFDKITNPAGYLVTLGRAAMLWHIEHHPHSPGHQRRLDTDQRRLDAEHAEQLRRDRDQQRAENTTPEARDRRAKRSAAIKAITSRHSTAGTRDNSRIPLLDPDKPKAWGPRP